MDLVAKNCWVEVRPLITSTVKLESANFAPVLDVLHNLVGLLGFLLLPLKMVRMGEVNGRWLGFSLSFLMSRPVRRCQMSYELCLTWKL